MEDGSTLPFPSTERQELLLTTEDWSQSPSTTLVFVFVAVVAVVGVVAVVRRFRWRSVLNCFDDSL